ncbi:MAG: hypothetical protein K2I42_01000, partial [Anaeroplasmataceae bacterium]|nr:hypothetical protein [Anaeroplasmataceae bacterium]
LKNENLYLTNRNKLNEPNLFFLDLADFKSILEFIRHLRLIKFDYIFVNSGACLEKDYTKDGIEKNFMINSFSPYYIVKKITEYQENCTVILTSSISILKGQADLNPRHWKHIYRNTKYMEHMLFKYLQKMDEKNKYIFAHPGITKSSISYSLHNLFVRFWISYFGNSNEAAAEVLVSAMNTKEEVGSWVCPSGLFHLSGTPKSFKIKRDIPIDDRVVSYVLSLEKDLEEKYKYIE